MHHVQSAKSERTRQAHEQVQRNLSTWFARALTGPRAIETYRSLRRVHQHTAFCSSRACWRSASSTLLVDNQMCCLQELVDID